MITLLILAAVLIGVGIEERKTGLIGFGLFVLGTLALVQAAAPLLGQVLAP